MKTGTITFHCAHNYGAVLQAYALQQTIQELGHTNYIVDFRPPELVLPYELRLIPKPFNIKRLLTGILTFLFRYKKYYKFEEFINTKLILTEKKYNNYNEVESDIEDFDALITGSDQVWNPEISLLKPYFLGFDNKNLIKISYAASFGVDFLEEKYKKVISKDINDIDFISVREDKAVNIIDNLIKREARQVLDPVFLLEKEKWHRLAENKMKMKKKYILVYALETNQALIDLALKISELKGYKILFINPDLRLKSILKPSTKKVKILRTLGPEEMLGLIKNAEMIITNSFHGTAFSIIFEKPFLCIPHSTRNSRLKSILNILNLNDQMINGTLDNEKSLFNRAFYDHEIINKLLKREIEKSKNFLKTALG